MYIDGSAGQKHKAAGFILKSPKGTEFAYALKYNFPVSNNESEYKVLLAGIRMALAMNVDQLIIRGDSKVFYGYVTGPKRTT